MKRMVWLLAEHEGSGHRPCHYSHGSWRRAQVANLREASSAAEATRITHRTRQEFLPKTTRATLTVRTLHIRQKSDTRQDSLEQHGTRHKLLVLFVHEKQRVKPLSRLGSTTLNLPSVSSKCVPWTVLWLGPHWNVWKVNLKSVVLRTFSLLTFSLQKMK